MTLNVVKLCVGVQAPQDLRDRFAARVASSGGGRFIASHVTRMRPGRAEEIAGKGSLYWVMKGQICCRQAILGFEEAEGSDGIKRCRFLLDTEVIDVQPRPKRPFQGWRYLTAQDAPPDLGAGVSEAVADMPDEMRRELAAMGLL